MRSVNRIHLYLRVPDVLTLFTRHFELSKVDVRIWNISERQYNNLGKTFIFKESIFVCVKTILTPLST